MSMRAPEPGSGVVDSNPPLVLLIGVPVPLKYWKITWLKLEGPEVGTVVKSKAVYPLGLILLSASHWGGPV